MSTENPVMMYGEEHAKHPLPIEYSLAEILYLADLAGRPRKEFLADALSDWVFVSGGSWRVAIARNGVKEPPREAPDSTMCAALDTFLTAIDDPASRPLSEEPGQSSMQLFMELARCAQASNRSPEACLKDALRQWLDTGGHKLRERAGKDLPREQVPPYRVTPQGKVRPTQPD